MKTLGVVTGCIVALAAGAVAKQGGGAAPPPQPPASIQAEVNGYYTPIATNIVRSAAMVSPEMYTWQPTPEVRSFARLFAHIADDNNGACAALVGGTPPPARLDAGSAGAWAADKMSKADLEHALADSVALCQKAFAAITAANMMEPAGRGTRTKLGNLIYNTSHINEHYGNLVTYLRLKDGAAVERAARRRAGRVNGTTGFTMGNSLTMTT